MNSLNSIINSMTREYYVNGIRVTRGYAGRHALSLSTRVFRRFISLTLKKITDNPYNRYKDLLHIEIVDDRKMNTLHWIYRSNTRMSYYRPYKQKRKYLSLFSYN